MNSLLEKIFKSIEDGKVSYLTNWNADGIGRYVIVFNMSQMDQKDVIFMQQPDNIMSPVTHELMGLAWTYAPNFGSVKLSDAEYDSVIKAIEQKFEQPISELSSYKIKYSTAGYLNYERKVFESFKEELQAICDQSMIEALMEWSDNNDRVEEFKVYIGQSVKVLTDFARSKNMTVRQIIVDDQAHRHSDRLNIDSEKGIVTAIRGIY